MERNRVRFSKGIIATILVVAVIIIGVIVYFTLIRTGDSDYDTLTKQLAVVTDNANSINTLSEGEDIDLGSISEGQLAAAKKLSDDYNSALQVVSESTVLQRDSVLKAAYSRSKSVLENYGRSTADMVETMNAVAAVKQSCNNLLLDIDNLTSLTMYEDASSQCTNALDNNKTVPQSDFNEEYYSTYHKELTVLLAALRAYYVAGEAGLVAQQQKDQAKITATLDSIQQLNDSNRSLITNTDSPIKTVAELSRLVAERKSMLFR